jgi:D-alanyl-D-alanine carboxypeptidase/D-alanyl-D-alanine-endopeptidase (penicillin-binding protein 4)
VRRWWVVALGCVIALALAAGAFVALKGRSGSASAGRQPNSPAFPSSTVRPRPAVLGPLATDAPAPGRGAVTAALDHLVDVKALGDLGGLVVDAGTGRTLFSMSAAVGAPPASTTKLLTAYAALRLLPADTTLDTSVVRQGSTLYLVGGGDMTLATRPRPGYPPTATLQQLAAATAQSVSSEPRGGLRLRYDETAWQGPERAPGWNADYFTGGDVSHLSPLEVDEARVGPDQSGRVPDPAGQAAAAFAAQLRNHGVDLRGAPAAAAAPDGAATLATVSSPSLTVLVHRMLTVSDNDLAESLGRRIAVATGRAPTFAGEASALTATLDHAGMATAQLHLDDASGLSRLDRIAPVTLAAVLRAALADPTLAPILGGLPVAGFTGTLADRFRARSDETAAGVTRAKTGTLTGDSALAGDVVDADGRLLIFVLLTRNAPATDPAEAALDRIVVRLANCGCPGST